MSLTFKSLSGLQTSNVFDSAAKMVFHSGSQFFNASMDELKTFFTEDVNARIDELGEATNGLPSIWPTARTIALTGLVTGSVAVDGSKNVAIATAIADGALSIAKTAGLATQLQDLRTDVDNIEAAVGDDLQATLDGKADKVHTHLGTESTTVNATYANNLVGVNAAQLGATYGANAVGVVGNDGTGRQVAVFGFGTTANPQLGFRIFNNNAWSPIYQTFHTGNFDPSTKQDLLRNIPIVEIGRGNTTGPTALQLYIGSAAGAWFQKGQGNAALEIGTTSTTGIKLSSGTGGALTFNDLPVYHSGNLNVNTLLKAGDAIKEVFTDTPTAYGSGVSVNFDALPTGRAIIASDANASNPPAAATEWYVETYTTAATQKFQRAVVRGTGEMWARVYTGSAWTAWRRYMDSTNLGTSGYLKTGDFGIGTTGGGFDWANTSPQSQFAVGNAGGPNGAINYMGLRVSMGGSPLYAMSLAARNGRLCFQTIEGGTVGNWFDIHHSGNFDPTSKLDTAVATSYGMGAVPAMATFGAHTLQGLSHAPVLSTASDKPAGISAGTYLAMTMQSGTRATGALGQFIMSGLNTANPEAYIRTGLNNAYGAWAKLLTSVNTDLSKFLTAGPNLDNVINLNTMTSTNYYQQLLDASATAALNYPVTMGGVLIVYTATNGYTHQEYRPRDGSAVWIRSLYSGSWSAWAKQYNSLNFTTTFTAGNGLTGGGDVSANRTITLGTPGTLSGTTTNAVSTASHTHELNMVYNPADQTSTWDSYPQNVVSMGQITAGGPSAASPHITAAFSNGNRVGQLVFDVNGGTGIPNIYYRTHHTSMNGGGWTSFIKVWSEVNQFALGPTQASARTALGIGTTAYLDSDRVLTLNPGKLLDNTVTDFGVADNSIGTGLYQYHSANSVGGPAGASWGSVIHMRRAAGGGETQIYTSEAGQMSIRGRTTGAWTTWNTVFHSNNAAVAGPLISPYINGHTIVTENIGAGKDLNDYVAVGLYLQPNNSNVTSGANYPSTLAGWLTVTANGTGTYVHQSYSNYNSGATYVRTRYNGTWYPWRMMWDTLSQFDIGTNQASARTALGLNTAAYQPDTNVPLLSRSVNSIGAAATDWRLAASSAAGSDVLSMRFASGGAYNPSRGAILELNGLNTAADAGAFRLLAAPGSAPRISAGEGSTLTITAGNTGTLALVGTTTVTGTLSTNNSFTFGANSVGLLYQGSTSAASLRVNDGGGGFRYFTFNGATGNIEALNGTFVVGSSKSPVWHSGNFDPGQYIQNNAITAADITARTNSGSFQASNPTAGYPENGTSVGWWHMLGTTHNNAGNYYALQFSAQFDRPNELWYRNTAGLGTRAWNKIWHSGNMTPLDVNNGGSVLNSLNVYVGGVNTQQRLMNYGYVNGVPRWVLAIEADGGLGYYSYNASGAGAKRIMRVSSTLAGGNDEVSVVGTASANKLVVYGVADAHVELQPTGQRAIRFAATSNVGFWDNTNSVWMLRFDTGNTCYMAGNVQATDFILSSDIRLKKDIKPLEFKGRLNPIEYTMAKTGRREMGFSAQDVQKDYPTAVTENEGELGVAYPRLVPVVAAQVNQVEDRVSALEAENVELKDRLAELEALVAKLVS